jgi:hypothetical protein
MTIGPENWIATMGITAMLIPVAISPAQLAAISKRSWSLPPTNNIQWIDAKVHPKICETRSVTRNSDLEMVVGFELTRHL